MVHTARALGGTAMAVQTFSPASIARDLSTKGRVITDKAVRGMARSIIARFDKIKHPAYQSHEYTGAERRVLLDAFAARAKGNAPKVAKPRAKRAKVATVAPVAS